MKHGKNKNSMESEDNTKVVDVIDKSGDDYSPVENDVNEPGACIGHWADCEECKMCEIEESCSSMTKNINGESDNE